ncbi:hypothetical protein FSP39_014660 [Pinctada imbricata]|uniref:Uncharacterized protein n=1 Tax=Pinctada imbricata TaxID=66713 RepID=A0AA88XDU8_PINIB|nr:hypothetical protein FSP39_014660 [Pinctada imbricata]
MASSGLFCDFDDITAQHGPAGLYCHSLSQLYEVCIKDESILHQITYNDACQRLKRNVNNTLATLDVRGYPIIEFKFGRSFTTAKTKCKLRPDKPITWNQDKGIASDWKEILKEGYDGVAVLTCINKELVPNYIQDVIKFKSSNGTRQKNQHGIDHRFYAQGLLNALIQHYTFSEPDGRIRNSCFAGDKKDNDAALPEILYMAFKVEKRPEVST